MKTFYLFFWHIVPGMEQIFSNYSTRFSSLPIPCLHPIEVPKPTFCFPTSIHLLTLLHLPLYLFSYGTRSCPSFQSPTAASYIFSWSLEVRGNLSYIWTSILLCDTQHFLTCNNYLFIFTSYIRLKFETRNNVCLF